MNPKSLIMKKPCRRQLRASETTRRSPNPSASSSNNQQAPPGFVIKREVSTGHVVQVFYPIFMHAVHCRDVVCMQRGCLKLKQKIGHYKRCPSRITNNCSTCKKVAALATHHAKQCSQLTTCPVPFCSARIQRIRQLLRGDPAMPRAKVNLPSTSRDQIVMTATLPTVNDSSTLDSRAPVLGHVRDYLIRPQDPAPPAPPAAAPVGRNDAPNPENRRVPARVAIIRESSPRPLRVRRYVDLLPRPAAISGQPPQPPIGIQAAAPLRLSRLNRLADRIQRFHQRLRSAHSQFHYQTVRLRNLGGLVGQIQPPPRRSPPVVDRDVEMLNYLVPQFPPENQSAARTRAVGTSATSAAAAQPAQPSANAAPTARPLTTSRSYSVRLAPPTLDYRSSSFRVPPPPPLPPVIARSVPIRTAAVTLPSSTLATQTTANSTAPIVVSAPSTSSAQPPANGPSNVGQDVPSTSSAPKKNDSQQPPNARNEDVEVIELDQDTNTWQQSFTPQRRDELRNAITQAEDEAYRNASSWNDYQKLLSGKLCDIRTEFEEKHRKKE